MQRLQAESATNPERPRQLAAVQYYLHRSLWLLIHDWRVKVQQHGSNYDTLLDHIAHYRRGNETVALVTFNYDTLLEDAMTTVKIRVNTLADYVAHEYKVFKLHGSINWTHPIETPITRVDRNFWDILTVTIDRAAELKMRDEIQILPIGTHLLAGVEVSHFYPAIAVPLQEKGTFECPGGHVHLLRSLLPNVSRVLIVGWRGSEAHFCACWLKGTGCLLGDPDWSFVEANMARAQPSSSYTLRASMCPLSLRQMWDSQTSFWDRKFAGF